MKKAVVYIHGMGGNAAEAAHYAPLFPGCDVIGFDYRSQTPREAKAEFSAYFDGLCKRYDSVSVIAVSLGAYFAMHLADTSRIGRAYFISPVVDMEALILKMMKDADVTEDELCRKKRIGTLSWDYLCFVRENPIRWNVPTQILYGENDTLTALETMTAFAEKLGASVEIMPNGEHWFHTPEQMRFLDEWITERQKE